MSSNKDVEMVRMKGSDGPEDANLQEKLLENGSPSQEALKGGITWPLVMSVCAAAFGSAFIFGYNIGVINSPETSIRKWINESTNGTYSESSIEFIWSGIASIFALGGMIGGILSGLFADGFGRKGGMLLNNIIALIAACLMGFCKVANSYWLLIFGRLVIGINCGLNSALCPMYLTEISPINLRGMLGSVNQLVLTIAILVAQIMSMNEIMGNDYMWPTLLALTAIPAIFQLIALPFCPESPKYLLVAKNKPEEAKKALIKLRQKNDVGPELNEMKMELNKQEASPKLRFLDMFRDKVLRWALIIAAMMMLSQQFSGINAVMFYSTRIFRDAAKLNEAEAQRATLGVGAINILMTLISTAIIDKAGRRFLHLGGLGGMWVCSIMLTVFIILTEHAYKWASYVSIIFLFGFVVSFALGPGSIPWFFVSELFNQNARGHATSVAVPVNWFAAFIVCLAFPPLQTMIRQYTFLIFAGLLTIFWLFTYKFVPETKNRPIDDVVNELRDFVNRS